MIQLRSMLKVADNSGAKIIQCVNVPGGTRKRYAQLGDIIVGTVKKAEPRKLVKKHEVVKAIIVRQRKEFKRLDGSYIRFDDNAVVVLGEGKLPKGGRVFGPIAKEVKDKGFDKIAMMAAELL
ncbi:MAG: 50S ribosomal protein L14 [Parcubacteria group bacterium GW2011_GWA1_33_6]|uniref:Large ribosomal subunit protein uL14 n=1 Tax=Candidatus Staskawiczbacteria bacterium RIFCSPHIGHO2_02_FULL_33_16 TaxID=1802204 RepID=A0A1G2HU60_9BACT|nr:MAG: 50S ribosomal protein L14 [Parcubacteria group bacterium GW2011_GWA2_33_14]KKP54225.1 MAG: 50S ribosomal protein L14 [Parcubacteria group bacterium GW2011_GWA1_33_6]OGZ65939.1 MAG: 50S ribosomal protein L14 [Candidatus Staskawiczbacteria bacterium RIFCSPHIGHO2_02_FULL_33_16]OGZ70563.1 MAG: 50S ribosomal protein L14 [Candidatus Staskawiczbacteria bacterium RIFCSPLOWO2_01_FULL_33_13]